MGRKRIAIIGGGPAGYVAAIRASHLGAEVMVVEKDRVGGTCVNRGCIPTKSLIYSVNMYNAVRVSHEFGISVSEVRADFPKMMQRKERVVHETRDGILKLLEANKVTLKNGCATLSSPNEGSIRARGVSEKFNADHIILATGSRPKRISTLNYDDPCILTTDDALELDHVPESMIVLGGGAVGVELACIFAGLGVKVFIMEMEDQLIPDEDRRIARFLLQELNEMGIEVLLDCTLENVAVSDSNGIRVLTGDGNEIAAERLLVCIGREPFTEGLGIEGLDLKMNQKGVIQVDERMCTSVEGVYAVGDVNGRAMLAHAASAQGITAVENALGTGCPADYSAIPRSIYSNPEVASVGLSRDQARSAGKSARIGKALFGSNGKALVLGSGKGLAQIVAEKGTGKILGAQIIGPGASEMIAELAVAVRNELTAEDLGESIHPHPALVEIVQEAARDAYGKSIYKLPW